MDMLDELEKIHGRAAQAVREKNGRRFQAFLQLQERWKARRGGLIQYGGQSGDRRGAINRNRRQFSSTTRSISENN